TTARAHPGVLRHGTIVPSVPSSSSPAVPGDQAGRIWGGWIPLGAHGAWSARKPRASNRTVSPTRSEHMERRKGRKSVARAKPERGAGRATPSAAKKPNILVIWGDDIGISNLSCYSHGVMGYQTPNIDRIAREGMLFTDSYGEQSCTAGRSSFITGQSVYRPGLSKCGIPAAPIGMSQQSVTIAAL